MKAISFWEMISSLNNSICIPRIQRDYAQGRIGKELLRQRLLMRCKEVLDDPSQHLLLDFVYGSKDDENKYYPLDGQQRLTTLWLLHWFVAFNANELDDETRNYLSNFSYETRRSSSDFCKFLCQLKYTSGVSSSKDLRSYISSQTKFSAKWMLDPTVSAMLNTLCGTNITDDNDNDIQDGLAEIFDGCDETVFKTYFSILKSSDCPIKFYNLDMRGENLPLSDDLYIKMNARGKQLSDWENFKADLLDFVDNKEELGYAIDGVWTDLFWHKKRDDGQIDAVLFAFVNRYIFNEYLCDNSIDSPSTKHSLYSLYGASGNDTALRYEDFLRYRKDVSANITKRAFEKLQKLMERLAEFQSKCKQDFDDLNNTIASGWSTKSKEELNADNFKFFPSYETSGISKVNINQRLVFLAVCRYFENVPVNEFNKDKLKDWVRFTWNIGEYIRTYALSNAFILINEKSEYCADILGHLKDINPDSITAKNFASDQIKEEIEKAVYIINNPDRKVAVLNAEKFRDLHGHIDFLFHDENGNLDWGNFDSKYSRLKELFEGKDIDSVSKLRNANFLKTFLSHCNLIKQIESSPNNYSYIYDYSWESWKANFQNPKYAVPTHRLLMNEEMYSIEGALEAFEKHPEHEIIYTKIYKWLLETDIMEQVATRLKSGKQRPYLRRYFGELCLYPSAEGIIMQREHRDSLLKLLYNKGLIQLKDEDIFSATNGERLFIKGWGISFTYKGIHFYWSWKNLLYINDSKYRQINDDILEDDFLSLLDLAIKSTENA